VPGGEWEWEGPFHALDTPRDRNGVAVNIPNVGVGPVPVGTVLPGFGPIQAFMAIEGNTQGSDGNFLAVNVGSDGNLGANWVNLNYSTHSLGPGTDVCQAGGCPAARYANGYFYVMGGGIDLVRSRNLSHGSWERPPLDPVVWGCTDGWEDCGPGSGVARIAEGFFTQYWAEGRDNGMRSYLHNISEWNWSSSDNDFCEHNGTTFFIYSMNGQGAPTNWTGKPGNFYSLGTYSGGLAQWLESFYSQPGTPKKCYRGAAPAQRRQGGQWVAAAV